MPKRLPRYGQPAQFFGQFDLRSSRYGEEIWPGKPACCRPDTPALTGRFTQKPVR
jgi:hypothetical protein